MDEKDLQEQEKLKQDQKSQGNKIDNLENIAERQHRDLRDQKSRIGELENTSEGQGNRIKSLEEREKTQSKTLSNQEIEIATLKSEVDTSLEMMGEMDDKIYDQGKEIKSLKSDMNATVDLMANQENEIADLKSQVASMKADMDKLMGRTTEKSGEAPDAEFTATAVTETGLDSQPNFQQDSAPEGDSLGTAETVNAKSISDACFDLTSAKMPWEEQNLSAFEQEESRSKPFEDSLKEGKGQPSEEEVNNEISSKSYNMRAKYYQGVKKSNPNPSKLAKAGSSLKGFGASIAKKMNFAGKSAKQLAPMMAALDIDPINAKESIKEKLAAVREAKEAGRALGGNALKILNRTEQSLMVLEKEYSDPKKAQNYESPKFAQTLRKKMDKDKAATKVGIARTTLIDNTNKSRNEFVAMTREGRGPTAPNGTPLTYAQHMRQKMGPAGVARMGGEKVGWIKGAAMNGMAKLKTNIATGLHGAKNVALNKSADLAKYAGNKALQAGEMALEKGKEMYVEYDVENKLQAGKEYVEGKVMDGVEKVKDTYEENKERKAEFVGEMLGKGARAVVDKTKSATSAIEQVGASTVEAFHGGKEIGEGAIHAETPTAMTAVTASRTDPAGISGMLNSKDPAKMEVASAQLGSMLGMDQSKAYEIVEQAVSGKAMAKGANNSEKELSQIASTMVGVNSSPQKKILASVMNKTNVALESGAKKGDEIDPKKEFTKTLSEEIENTNNKSGSTSQENTKPKGRNQ